MHHPYIDIRDFGAVPSTRANPICVAQAIEDAIESVTVNQIRTDFAASGTIFAPPCIIENHDGLAHYYLSRPVEVRRICHILGAGNGGRYGATRFEVEAGQSGFIFHDDDQQFGAYGSILEKVSIETRNSVRDEGFGIFSNTKLKLVDVGVYGFGNDNIRIDATGRATTSEEFPPTSHYSETGTHPGNANLCYLERVTARDSKRNGIRLVGNNVNTGLILMPNLVGNRGYGILDQSQHGNTVITPHFQGNGTVVAHGTHTVKVMQDGELVEVEQARMYQCYRTHEAFHKYEPGVGSEWEKVWYQYNVKPRKDGSTVFEVQDPASIDEYWEAGIEYAPGGSYQSYHALQGSAVFAPYVEATQQAPARIGHNSAWVFGSWLGGRFRPIGTDTSIIAGQGNFTNLRIHDYDYLGREVGIDFMPGRNSFMQFGNSDDGKNGTTNTFSLVNRTNSYDGYAFIHHADLQKPLLEFERDGSKATIKQLEERIAALEVQAG